MRPTMMPFVVSTCTISLLLPHTCGCNWLRKAALAIGTTEEAHVRMGCDPRLPIFPRDYPDARQGQAYWSLGVVVVVVVVVCYHKVFCLGGFAKIQQKDAAAANTFFFHFQETGSSDILWSKS